MHPRILGVADLNENAVGMQLAKKLGIFTTRNYRDLFTLRQLQVLVELTSNPGLPQIIKKNLPPDLKLIDHFEARALLDEFEIETVRREGLKRLADVHHDLNAVKGVFNASLDRFGLVLRKKNERSRKIELKLADHERAQSQIIEGSTIPTFIINRDHVVTHWNKALERLSGAPAEEIVGTQKQGVPFWKKERPTMADAILDQMDEAEMKALYGSSWRKSTLIDGAYEAEVFFPDLGPEGKWCWFTAAPIKAPDGTIAGAIETLWDRTEDKKAEQERELHTRELSTLCSLYSALNAPVDIDERVAAAVDGIRCFFSSDSVSIFILGDDEYFYLKYDFAADGRISTPDTLVDKQSPVYRVARNGEVQITGNGPKDDPASDHPHGQSIAYIPVGTKSGEPFTVIRIESQQKDAFSHENKQLMELIGNRIGIAIENAMLQEQSIRSEEKYRSLFNNDPNPTFIVDKETLAILDTNQRAQACYGYTADEFIGMPFSSLGDKNDEEIAVGLKGISPHQSAFYSKKKHFKKNGQPLYVSISVSKAEYDSRDVLIASTTDITESVETETQLIQAGKMATLGVMAAGMAHEINQPLNVIQVCAEFFLKTLKRGNRISDKDLESMTNDIIASVSRATGVIKHVRDFARQSEVVRNKLNINDPIKDVFKVMGHQLKAHQIDVKLALDPSIPYIMGEHNRLEQVFINLVTNAIDAMDEKEDENGSKAVEKRLEIKTVSANGQVIVRVSDTGVGMTEEVRHKIFEPFFTTKETGKGTGLGVSISYGIVKDYDGTIDIESEIGIGTTFILKFPAALEKR